MATAEVDFIAALQTVYALTAQEGLAKARYRIWLGLNP